MHLSDLPFLESPAARSALAALADDPPTPATHLAWVTRLRETFSAEHTHALLTTALLRPKAAAKFSRAAAMLFTADGLEMSSAETVARYRARRFAPFAHVADLGCGIGGDAIGLAAVAHVTGIDRDPLHLALAQHNVAVYGLGDRFTPRLADLADLVPLPVDAVFFDPARRDDHGRRIRSVADYRPPLATVDRWRAVTAHAGVKVSPGIDYAELPADATVEFISVRGEVREGVLWYGDLRGAARQATLLDAGGAVVAALTSADLPLADLPPQPPGRFLYEPDGAVIRAHLVQALAFRLDARQLDATIAYLTADAHIDTPLATAYRVLDWFPFQLKRLRSYLRGRGIGRITVKKRGSPLDPVWLQRQLRLSGAEEGVIVLTQHGGQPVVLVVEPVATAVTPRSAASETSAANGE